MDFDLMASRACFIRITALEREYGMDAFWATLLTFAGGFREDIMNTLAQA